MTNDESRAVAMSVVRSIIVLFLLLTADVGAVGLSASFETADLQPRMNGPVPIPATIQWDGPGLLEGYLEATLIRRGHSLGVVHSPPMFLSPGKRSVVFTLPPPPGVANGDSLDASVRFVGKGNTWDLGKVSLGSIQLGSAKELILCVARSGQPQGEFSFERERSLALERQLPKLTGEFAGVPGLVTTRQTSLKTGDFPTNPAGFCAYDAVFLDGRSFAQLNEKQLAALMRWVRAGGNLALTPGDQATPALADRHLVFLRRLFAGSGFRASLGDGGRLSVTSGRGVVATASVSPELGRMVVVAATETTLDLGGAVWRSAVNRLWKTRYERFELAENGGRNWPWQRPFSQSSRGIWVGQAAAGFAPLAPDAPRQIPFRILGCILAVLLLAVAPGEWFILGRLRRRRWTWVVFPFMCAACAWFVSGLASRYVGFQSRSGSLRIVDVGADGRIIRDVRFEQLLPSTDFVWTHDVRDGVAVPVEPETFEEPDEHLDERAPATSEWGSSERLVLKQTLRQWTPSLVRVTTFPDSEDDSGLDWRAVRAAGTEVAQSVSGMKTLDGWTVAISGGIMHLTGSDMMDRIAEFQSGGMSEARATATTLVRAADVTNFGLVTRYSPAIGGHYSDLATYSPDEHEVVAAWRRVGSEFVIYRRHFPKAPSVFQDYRDQ